jgi:hypothetical protein
MTALGVPTEIPRAESLTRFQRYLGLADALFCRAQPTGDHLGELARAFAYDVLNLAVLAGRLLWYEGVTPQIWRSHDLIDVGVDTEAYYVMLQCACDIMADVVATLGARKGQAPSESFHKLNQWALRNPNRLASEFQIVASHLPWFDKINSRRTEIVHRGEKPHTYTDRVSFNSGRLLLSARELTREMLDFSEELGRIVLPETARERFPEKRVIDGVYVPALDHLLNKYQVPEKSPELKLIAQCLLGCGGYVEAAYMGYPDGFWWKLLLTISRSFNVAPFATDIPVNSYGDVRHCTFVFSSNGMSCGFISYDEGGRGWSRRDWQEAARESAEQLRASCGVEKIAIVVRTLDGHEPQPELDKTIPVIISNDPKEAADMFLTAVVSR